MLTREQAQHKPLPRLEADPFEPTLSKNSPASNGKGDFDSWCRVILGFADNRMNAVQKEEDPSMSRPISKFLTTEGIRSFFRLPRAMKSHAHGMSACENKSRLMFYKLVGIFFVSNIKHVENKPLSLMKIVG